MSHNSSSSSSPSTCKHNLLNFTPSTHAAEVGYRTPTAQQQRTALGKRKRDVDDEISSATFPAPLVLPGDELSLDPQCPGQSLDDWRCEEDRNEVTRERNVIYVAAPPDVAPDVEFIRSWGNPQLEGDGSRKKDAPSPGNGSSSSIPPSEQPFQIEEILDYLAAFFYGMPVKILPPGSLLFTSWGDKKPKNSAAKARHTSAPRFIGLNTPIECIRIRTRASSDGIFPRQLNLDDLLDTAISILPQDAYALLLLMQHDLFEDADDEFVCGRAYGGSRVAVISTARNNPSLDSRANVEIEHAWPASHCASYMKACCEAASASASKTKTKRRGPKKPSKLSKSAPPPQPTITTALQAAISAFTPTTALPSPSPSPSSISTLWLSRVCRTASHELGHCFGIDHCIYHACVMQGSASLREDVRQPPYLCPVDLAKVLEATTTTTTRGCFTTKASSTRGREGHGNGENDRGRVGKRGQDGKGKDEDVDGEDQSRNITQPQPHHHHQRQRYEALRQICTDHHHDEGMFAAFGAWIGARCEGRGG